MRRATFWDLRSKAKLRLFVMNMTGIWSSDNVVTLKTYVVIKNLDKKTQHIRQFTKESLKCLKFE